MNSATTRREQLPPYRALAWLSALVLAGAAMYSTKALPQDGQSFLATSKAVSNDRLQENRGASDYKVANLNDVHGTLQNNSAVDIVSGHNTISNGSFSAVTGFPLVVQNSGTNVVIQSSTIVNIGLQP